MASGIVTLITALLIAAIAAYFSIAGLMAIFSGAAIAVAVMAGSLELGKLVTASWLYRNWKETGWLLKSYLTVAVVVLMFITSLGIFGYLSKAHSDQSVISGGAVEQVTLFDEKIKYQRELISTNQKVIAQMDDVVNQTLSRTTDAEGAERALQVRRSQSRDRQRLVAEISAAQAEIQKLNEQRAPLSVELKKVESEVGPIKYVAALIYGDNPEANLMERAVRWMIILLVVVFDPLAVALLIAANQTLNRHKNKSADPDKTETQPIVTQEESRPTDPQPLSNEHRDWMVDRNPPVEPAVDLDQKKRSPSYKSKFASLKKKITPNQKKS